MYPIVKQARTYAGNLTTAQVAILERLADYADKEGDAAPSARTLAKETGYSERTVFKAFALFKRLGIIFTPAEEPEKFAGYKSVTRSFNMPEDWHELARPARPRSKNGSTNTLREAILMPVEELAEVTRVATTPTKFIQSFDLSITCKGYEGKENPHFVRILGEPDMASHYGHETETTASDPAAGLWDEVDEPTPAPAQPSRNGYGKGWAAVRAQRAAHAPRPRRLSPVQQLVSHFIDTATEYRAGPGSVNAAALGQQFRWWIDKDGLTQEQIKEMIDVYFAAYRRGGVAWTDFLNQRMTLWNHIEKVAKLAEEDEYNDDSRYRQPLVLE